MYRTKFVLVKKFQNNIIILLKTHKTTFVEHFIEFLKNDTLSVFFPSSLIYYYSNDEENNTFFNQNVF